MARREIWISLYTNDSWKGAQVSNPRTMTVAQSTPAENLGPSRAPARSAASARPGPLALETVYRGLERADAIDDRVAQHARRLAAVTPVISCRALIQASTHHAHGKPFRVRLELVLPDGNLDVNHDPARGEGHADLFHALHEAFQCARRRIEESSRYQREEPRRRVPH
jgi:hypothetical protein